MQAVMMVAGKSTRTYPLTLSRPKPLLPIMNKPLIEHSLDQMVGLFDEVIFIVGYRKEMINHALGDNYRGIKLIYQEQKEQLGTGHAVLQAKPHIRDKFVALNGDDLFAREDFERLIQYDNGALALEVEDPSSYGVLTVDEDNRLLNLVEKPKEFLGNLANIGCYVFEPDIFAELERTPLSERGEIEITSAIASMATRKVFKVVSINGFWLPTGYAWDLLKHQEYLMSFVNEGSLDGQVESGAIIKGPVVLGAGSVIKSGAYIEGPVFIGKDCQIGPNCYIRKYTSIGDNCRVGQGVEIKNSLVMNNSNVCHLSYIGDSVIGEGCNIGAGTNTANKRHDDAEVQSMIKGKLVQTGRVKLGAILSDGVQTGINTSIYPGRKLWPKMTTLPGEVVKKDKLHEDMTW